MECAEPIIAMKGVVFSRTRRVDEVDPPRVVEISSNNHEGFAWMSATVDLSEAVTDDMHILVNPDDMSVTFNKYFMDTSTRLAGYIIDKYMGDVFQYNRYAAIYLNFKNETQFYNQLVRQSEFDKDMESKVISDARIRGETITAFRYRMVKVIDSYMHTTTRLNRKFYADIDLVRIFESADAFGKNRNVNVDIDFSCLTMNNVNVMQSEFGAITFLALNYAFWVADVALNLWMADVENRVCSNITPDPVNVKFTYRNVNEFVCDVVDTSMAMEGLSSNDCREIRFEEVSKYFCDYLKALAIQYTWENSRISEKVAYPEEEKDET